METHRQSIGRFGAVVAMAAGFLSHVNGAARAEEDIWPSLQSEVFGSRPVQENDGVVALDAPERAEDAAVVPLTIRVPPSVKGQLKAMWLIIDKNPAPVAAALTIGPAAGQGGGERRFTTRVRIDTYSYVHAVVETDDGVLHMTKAFVKASGGCAAPAPKDADRANDDLGKTLVKSFDPAVETAALREAQIMIKHPNNNGMQMDPETRAYVPARFIRELTVMRGNDLVFKAETSFSLSANPNFRFTYENGKDNALEVTSIDTDETKFSARSTQVAVTQ
ncbi:quinoprotein dehydrogenase-associated SoxYZ-like carrier [Hyphomicrobium sp. DMF-1]|uniref:quinoprotein dehydrogenase-associated SoxYZ-like carrier n=1 Tax=Hyphomicrobium sp. DMF-1 TaxID=3019544 RepID=UPI0022EBC90E|nr:quinoprotein dehydrogenase-associated SoxYZ-like carrier [Hyphomicrobium sp. DMF-1]WBT38040.1 quinoprotein dehydrogenase-associated SoxYZ-like carrier [Hyphomicrobium sp. DMF-1]